MSFIIIGDTSALTALVAASLPSNLTNANPPVLSGRRVGTRDFDKTWILTILPYLPKRSRTAFSLVVRSNCPIKMEV